MALSGVPALGGYEYEFISPVPNKWVCLICHLPMKDPVQIVECGHRLCRMCADEVIRRQPSVCPADRTPISRDRLFPDVGCKREIQDLRVKCPNYCCEWTGELREVQEHCKKKCAYETVSCKNAGCEEKMKRKDLEFHMSSKCQWRIITCKFCLAQFPLNASEAHFAVECKRFLESCENKCGVHDIPREEIEEHLNACPLTVIQCDFKDMGCEEEFQRKDRGLHMDFTVKRHLDLMCAKVKDQCKVIVEHKEKREEHEKMITEQEARLIEQEAKIIEQGTKIAEQGTKIAEQETKIVEHETKITEYETKLTEQDMKMTEQTKQLSDLEEKLKLSQSEFDNRMMATERAIEKLIKKSNFEESTKDFVWTIHDIDNRLKHQNKITSEPFYLHGYRLKLSIFVKDLVNRASVPLGLTFYMTEGKLDDELEWPFKGKLKLTVANCKSRGGCLTDMAIEFPVPEVLSRPTRENDSGSGCYANLFLPRFADSDKTLVIKCEMGRKEFFIHDKNCVRVENKMAEGGMKIQLGGHEYEFVPKVPDKWICPICYLPLKEPVQVIGCGHRFCRMCMNEILKTRQPRCPTDRNFISGPEGVFPDVGCNREIHELTIRCQHKGCPWTGKLKFYNTHLLSCQKFPMQCDRDCGARGIPRDGMRQHMAEVCPNRPHVCDFHFMGCEETILHKNWASHLKLNEQTHLVLACRKIRQLEETVKQQAKTINELLSTVEKAYAEMSQLRGEGAPRNNQLG